MCHNINKRSADFFFVCRKGKGVIVLIYILIKSNYDNDIIANVNIGFESVIMASESSCKSFINSCRTCLNGSSTQQYNIFDYNKDSINIAHMILTCTGLAVSFFKL